MQQFTSSVRSHRLYIELLESAYESSDFSKKYVPEVLSKEKNASHLFRRVLANQWFKRAFKNLVEANGIFQGMKFIEGEKYAIDILILEILDSIWINTVY